MPWFIVVILFRTSVVSAWLAAVDKFFDRNKETTGTDEDHLTASPNPEKGMYLASGAGFSFCSYLLKRENVSTYINEQC
jgi:hypothetical protein